MELIAERSGPVATLTLNRPERLNAVSLPLYRALLESLIECDRDPNVRAIVLTGAGRAFCVGADLKAHDADEPTAQERRVYVHTAQLVHRRMQRVGKPIVAAVNGHAVGAGLELALSCDFVIVADTAKLRFPEVALGTFVGGGTVYTLPQRVGILRARELLLLADFFSAQDAVSWGLANRALPCEQVLPAALELAYRLAERAPRSLAYARRLLNHASQIDPRRALRLEARALLDCMRTRDWKEGVRAFHEKRDPEFTGE
jgi:enoyl-CoA hydratase/carnithine racemase